MFGIRVRSILKSQRGTVSVCLRFPFPKDYCSLRVRKMSVACPQIFLPPEEWFACERCLVRLYLSLFCQRGGEVLREAGTCCVLQNDAPCQRVGDAEQGPTLHPGIQTISPANELTFQVKCSLLVCPSLRCAIWRCRCWQVGLVQRADCRPHTWMDNGTSYRSR